jgi:polyphosphate kinase
VSDRIKVISIVGRFLEHSRIYYFSNNGDEELYFGSADWMPRNFDRRVEVITPIEDRNLHPRVCALLDTCLADNRQAWDLASDGTYVQRKPGTHPVVSTHERFLANSWGLQPMPAEKENGALGLHVPSEELAPIQSAVPTSSS